MDFPSFCFAFIVLIGGVIGYLKAGKYKGNTGKLIFSFDANKTEVIN